MTIGNDNDKEGNNKENRQNICTLMDSFAFNPPLSSGENEIKKKKKKRKTGWVKRRSLSLQFSMEDLNLCEIDQIQRSLLSSFIF